MYFFSTNILYPASAGDWTLDPSSAGPACIWNPYLVINVPTDYKTNIKHTFLGYLVITNTRMCIPSSNDILWFKPCEQNLGEFQNKV